MTDTGMCHNYRTVFPFTMLEANGWQVHWGAPPPDIYDYDVIVGQRLTGHNDLWQELSRKYSGLLVYDLDDDLIDIDPANTLPYNLYQPQRLDTIRNIQASDVVTVSTPKLAQKVCQWNANVVVLENRLPQSWLNLNTTPVPLRIGWAGSPFHDMDFTPELIAQIKGTAHVCSYHTIGGAYIPGAMHTGYGPLERALASYDFWVGLAPLKACEFNEGKSWCKAFEYASRGIPIVASDVGQYSEWINRFGGGVLVSKGGSFTEAIEWAIESRPKLSGEAWRAAQVNVIENHWEQWNAVYNGVW